MSNFLSYSDVCLQEHQSNNDPNSTNRWPYAWQRPLAAGDRDTINNDHQMNKQNKNAAKKLNKSNANVSAGDIVRTLPPIWSDFICMTCGTFLFHPVMTTANSSTDKSRGSAISTKDRANLPSIISSQATPLPSNIYLRPLKRGKTRRRRASQAKAKQLHNRSLSLQRRGTTNTANIQLRKDPLAKEEMQRIALSYCIGDGRAKNCLVMRCTHCGTKKKRKGLEVKAQKKTEADKTTNERKRDSKTKHDIRGEKKTLASQIRDNTDYISLTSLGGGAAKKSGKQHQRHDSEQAHGKKIGQGDTDAFTSPLLGGKKKKKKKKPEAKKGDLMDFLSSLND